MIRRTACALVVVLAGACIAPAAEKELHVVAVADGHGAPRDHSQPGTASVTVDRPGKEVVLVVHAYNAVVWDVGATPKTKLTKVLAVGYHRQTVTAPKGVEIEEQTYDGKKVGVSTNSIYGYHNLESPRFRPFVQKLSEHTKLEILSFQGEARFNPTKPFVVDAIQKEERLSSQFPKLAPAAQIPKLKFDATRAVFKKGRFDTSTGFGEWTQGGPTADGFTQLPKNIRQIAYDPKGKWHYGIDNHELYSVDVKNGTSVKIPPPNDKNFNWTQALTFDAKRERVIVAGRNGLFEYALKNGGQWTALQKDRSIFLAAIVWQAKTDTLYSFGVEHGKGSERLIPTLYELNANGAVANRTALGSPLFPGILGEHGLDGHAELIDLGADLALLVHCENLDSGARGKQETFLYVIDPKTGKTKLAWKE